MRIIDAHAHTIVKLPELKTYANNNGIDYSEDSLRSELKAVDAEYIVSFSDYFGGETPTAHEEMMRQASEIPEIVPFLAINPNKITKDGVKKVRSALRDENAYGIKIYSGYYHVSLLDNKYRQFYEIAGEFECPVMLHSGETLTEDGLLKYARPLTVDELAVEYRDTNFIIAHMGNPWIREAVVTIFKNRNVFGDISGLVIGDLEVETVQPWKKSVADDLKWVFNYYDVYKKILYGTDWPMVGMEQHLEFMKDVVPKQDWNDVFYNTAKKLLKL